MSNVIDFLERMGQDAQLRHASQGDVALALANTQIEPATRAAILAGNQSKLGALLGGGALFSAQFPGKEDEQEDEGDEGEKRDTEESRSLEGAGISSQHPTRDLALVL